MVNPFEETMMAGKVSDDYNIGRFGEFDRFQDERAFMPEMFERPQSTIGGYDEQGRTLPASEPDHWFLGYSRPGDVEERQRGIWPFMRRHAPEWAKEMWRGAKEGWEGTSLNPNINPRGMNQGLLGTQVAQSQWKRPDNMEKTIKSLELRPEFEGWTYDEIKYWIINQARANRGGIIGLNGGGTIHKDSKTPLPDDLRDQMYDWILQQMMKQREEEMREQWERDRNPMLYPPPIPEGGMEV